MEKPLFKKIKIYETLKPPDLEGFEQKCFHSLERVIRVFSLPSHGVPILLAKLKLLLKCSEFIQRTVQHFKLISRLLREQGTEDK